MGAYGVVLLDGKTGQMIVARKGSPLVLGINDDGVGVASTKAFTSQIVCLLMLSLWIEQHVGLWVWIIEKE